MLYSCSLVLLLLQECQNSGVVVVLPPHACDFDIKGAASRGASADVQRHLDRVLTQCMHTQRQQHFRHLQDATWIYVTRTLFLNVLHAYLV